MIERGVSSIGNYAFYDCYNLTGISVPEGVTEIGDYAFEYCGLASIDLPLSIASIGSSAFSSCYNLRFVYYAGSVGDRAGIAVGTATTTLRTPCGITRGSYPVPAERS